MSLTPSRRRRFVLTTGSLALTLLAAVSCTADVEPDDSGVAKESAAGRDECPLLSPVPEGPTTFGASLSTSELSLGQSLHRAQDQLGRLDIIRMFDPEVPPANAWQRRKPVLANRSIVASFRESPQVILSGRYDHRLREWFANAPRHRPVYWSYMHEPEAEMEAGDYTSSQYREAWRHLAHLAAGTCNPSLHSTLILTGWTADPESGRDWRDFYPGKKFIDVLGWDPYNSASSRPTSYESPAALFHKVVRVSREAGKPFGIAETGSQLVRGDHGAKRARWLRRMGQYLERHDAVFVTYFQSDHGADYRLLDRPSKRAWRTFVRR